MKKISKTSMVLSAMLIIAGCSSKVEPPQIIYETQILHPGAAQYVWEEPMVDVIDVPPGLDPDGVYYRPAHNEVVEIRQGRWKHYNGSAEGNK